MDSETQIRDGLATVNNDGWQLLYVDTKGNPKEPAHFLAVEKQAAPLKKSKSNDKTTSGDDTAKEETTIWQKVTGRNLADLLSPQDSVKVMIVVRGTKTLADVLSDGLLEATPFKAKYKAHGGIQQSGHYIVEKHIGRLKRLLEASGRSKIQLLLFGHSLGCGTAAIAAMEFHDEYKDIIDVKAVGFGCPSLISPELSEQYKDIITTVINDADIVPRMSGSSLVNLQLDMLSLDWTGYLAEELKALSADVVDDLSKWANKAGVSFAKDLVGKVVAFVENYLETTVKPSIKKAVEEAIPSSIKSPNQRVETELVPPGTCLHLYRTATGFDAAYTPCGFFDKIEYVPHLVQDHMTKSGYHTALLSLLRQQVGDENAVFENPL